MVERRCCGGDIGSIPICVLSNKCPVGEIRLGRIVATGSAAIENPVHYGDRRSGGIQRIVTVGKVCSILGKCAVQTEILVRFQTYRLGYGLPVRRGLRGGSWH